MGAVVHSDPTQPSIPVAGLGPAIHAFVAVLEVCCQDVGGRDKPGHGEQKLRYKSRRIARAAEGTFSGQPCAMRERG